MFIIYKLCSQIDNPLDIVPWQKKIKNMKVKQSVL